MAARNFSRAGKFSWCTYCSDVLVLIMRRRQTFEKRLLKRTEQGRPGTDAITQTQGVVIMQVHAPGVLSWVHNASLILSRNVRIDIESIGAWLCIMHNYVHKVRNTHQYMYCEHGFRLYIYMCISSAMHNTQGVCDMYLYKCS